MKRICKKPLVVFSFLVLTIVVSIIIIFNARVKYESESKIIDKEETDLKEDVRSFDNETEAQIIEEEQEKIKDEITHEDTVKEVNVENSNTVIIHEDKKETNNISNNNISETTTITEEKTESPVVVTTTRGECSNDDPTWLSYVRDKRNEIIFNTQSEAMDYVNYAESKGYGTFMNNYQYEGKTCYKSYWSVDVYTGRLTCGINNDIIVPNFDLPRTAKEDLVYKYEYVINQGYDCSDRLENLLSHKQAG